MSTVKVMCQVKRTETVLSIQFNYLFDECEELIKMITQSVGKNKEKLNKLR